MNFLSLRKKPWELRITIIVIVYLFHFQPSLTIFHCVSLFICLIFSLLFKFSFIYWFTYLFKLTLSVDCLYCFENYTVLFYFTNIFFFNFLNFIFYIFLTSSPWFITISTLLPRFTFKYSITRHAKILSYTIFRLFPCSCHDCSRSWGFGSVTQHLLQTVAWRGKGSQINRHYFVWLTLQKHDYAESLVLGLVPFSPSSSSGSVLLTTESEKRIRSGYREKRYYAED